MTPETLNKNYRLMLNVQFRLWAATSPDVCKESRQNVASYAQAAGSSNCYDSTVRKFHVQNFGCRATQADGSAIERQLLQKGFALAEEGSDPDFVVLNTCTVTASADQDARAAIRRIHRESPNCRILVTGCYAQRAPEEVAGLSGVTWIVGNSHKHRIADIAAHAVTPPPTSDFVPLTHLQGAYGEERGAGLHVGDIFAHTELLAAPVFENVANSGRTRPNLKVQDGCNNRCSFCVIPSVRGRSRSLTADEVLREVESLQVAGYREIVLSGINLGRWGRDLGDPHRLEDLTALILDRSSIEKIRISSVEPMDWSDRLIDLMASSPRIAKHVHIPLQSGSDSILRRMHRRYRPWHYAEKVKKIRTMMPEAAIGADVMVGFPGESDAHFDETRDFIEGLPLTYLHVFTYSSRPGTPSAVMREQVAVRVARERNRVLRELSAQKSLSFRSSFVGRTLPAITLTTRGGGSTEALSDNYIKVQVAGEHAANQWLRVHINAVSGDGLAGTLC
jgi:threonylcarbamoyladenosine tRNA methylthiotransferase MtaB